MSEPTAYFGSKVAAVAGETFVSKFRHQLGKQVCHSGGVHPTFCRLAGESKTRERRNDYVERIGRFPTVRCRIGKPGKQLHHFKKRSRPAMDQQDRDWRGSPSALVNKMDELVARDVLQVIQGCQPPDFRFPVKLLAPIAANALQVCEIKSVLPARTGNCIGPARVRESFTKVPNRTFGIW